MTPIWTNYTPVRWLAPVCSLCFLVFGPGHKELSRADVVEKRRTWLRELSDEQTCWEHVYEEFSSKPVFKQQMRRDGDAPGGWRHLTAKVANLGTL